MADQPPIDPPSTPDSTTSQIHAGKQPAAAISTSTSTSPPPPPKRQKFTQVANINTILSINSVETQDTTSTQPEERIEEVYLFDNVVLQELNEYEFLYGVNPVDDDHHMQMFCSTYINMGVGNQRGWEVKMIELKNMFKNQSLDTILPYQEEEFALWKKMFARVPPSDEGSRIS